MRVALLLFALSAPLAIAQPEANAACAEAYEALVEADELAPATGVTVDTCTWLARSLEDALSQRRLDALNPAPAVRAAAVDAVSPRGLQPARGAAGGAAGSAGQSDAVPGLSTEPLIGGAVSAVGTSQGTGALAAFSLNPLVLTGDLGGSRQLAQAARTVDLSVLVPIDDADRDEDGRLDYIGVRGRVNLLGRRNGARVYDSLLEEYVDALGDAFQEADVTSDRIGSLLTQAEDREGCAREILSGIATGCGQALVDGVDLLTSDVVRRLDVAAAKVREAADESYFGLDARFDYGDPTLGAMPEADGVAFTALVATGRDIGLATPGLGAALRAHLGVYFADRDSLDAQRFALDGAAGIGFTQLYGLQSIEGQVGIEGRLGLSGETVADVLDGDHLTLNASLNVPVTEQQSASVRFSLPLLGTSMAPVLSVSGNWHLPLPGRPGF